MHTWDIMDTTVQTLNMLRQTKSYVSRSGLEKQLTVKSKDGADVMMDVTIKYQIAAGKAWKVLNEFGKNDEYKEKVNAEAIEIMRNELGELTTEEFYDPLKRKVTTRIMEERLQLRLDRMYVKLVNILIRDLEFEKQFEDQIKRKALAQQDALLQQSLAKKADYRGRTQKILAETGAKVVVIEEDKKKTLTTMRAQNDKKRQRIEADYKKYVTETESAAELHASQKEAQGILLLKDAEAQGEALRRQALSGEGGRFLVALEMVKNIELTEIAVSTQLVNPLNLDQMMELLGVK
jgi:regulator of protease activity HflC (stomatin/prohibitin superfamily)